MCVCVCVLGVGGYQGCSKGGGGLRGGGPPLLPGSPYGPRRRRAKKFEAQILLAPKAPKRNSGCQPQTLEGDEVGGRGFQGGLPPPPPSTVYGRSTTSLWGGLLFKAGRKLLQEVGKGWVVRAPLSRSPPVPCQACQALLPGHVQAPPVAWGRSGTKKKHANGLLGPARRGKSGNASLAFLLMKLLFSIFVARKWPKARSPTEEPPFQDPPPLTGSQGALMIPPPFLQQFTNRLFPLASPHKLCVVLSVLLLCHGC